MIISPQSIIESSETFKEWQQVGRRMGKPGILKFLGNGEEKCITLHQKNGLYYCNTKTFDIGDSKYDSITTNKTDFQANKAKCPSYIHPTAPAKPKQSVPKSTKYKPTSKAKILEAETWYLRMGGCSKSTMDELQQDDKPLGSLRLKMRASPGRKGTETPNIGKQK
jgi:hypothetical protein